MNVSHFNNTYHCDNIAGQEYFCLAELTTAPTPDSTALYLRGHGGYETLHKIDNLKNTGRLGRWPAQRRPTDNLGRCDIMALEPGWARGARPESDLSAYTLYFLPNSNFTTELDSKAICFVQPTTERLFFNETLYFIDFGPEVSEVEFYSQNFLTSDYNYRKSVFIDPKSMDYSFYLDKYNEEKTEITATWTLSADFQTMRNISYEFPDELSTIDRTLPFFAMGHVDVKSNITAGNDYSSHTVYFTDYSTIKYNVLFVGGDDSTKFSDNNATIGIQHFSKDFNMTIEEGSNYLSKIRGHLEFDYLGMEET